MKLSALIAGAAVLVYAVGDIAHAGPTIATDGHHQIATDPPPTPEPDEPDDIERLSIVGFGLFAGAMQIQGDDVFSGGFGVRWGRRRGDLAVFIEADLMMLSEHTAPPASDPPMMDVASQEGMLGRIGAAARYSLWRPESERIKLRGDLFVSAGAGYKRGGYGDATVSEADIRLGVGVGYDILATSPASQAKSFSAYLAVDTISAVDKLTAPGWSFTVGMLWSK